MVLAMSVYPFLAIDNLNFAPDARYESAGVDSTPRTNSKADGQNLITEGAATLADFVVMLAHQAMPASARKPRNQTQGRLLQLKKEGIWTLL